MIRSIEISPEIHLLPSPPPLSFTNCPEENESIRQRSHEEGTTVEMKQPPMQPTELT
ncbi:putative basic-leucine zipper transcription factor I, partial [Clarias magur]